MMRNAVEPSDGVDPRQGFRGGQLSRRDGSESGGAIIALQGVEFSRSTLRLGERCGYFGRNAPGDGFGPSAQGAFRGDRAANRPRRAQRLLAQLGGATVVGIPGLRQDLQEA